MADTGPSCFKVLRSTRSGDVLIVSAPDPRIRVAGVWSLNVDFAEQLAGADENRDYWTIVSDSDEAGALCAESVTALGEFRAPGDVSPNAPSGRVREWLEGGSENLTSCQSKPSWRLSVTEMLRESGLASFDPKLPDGTTDWKAIMEAAERFEHSSLGLPQAPPGHVPLAAPEVTNGEVDSRRDDSDEPMIRRFADLHMKSMRENRPKTYRALLASGDLDEVALGVGRTATAMWKSMVESAYAEANAATSPQEKAGILNAAQWTATSEVMREVVLVPDAMTDRAMREGGYR